jgi:hypothetical protein
MVCLLAGKQQQNLRLQKNNNSSLIHYKALIVSTLRQNTHLAQLPDLDEPEPNRLYNKTQSKLAGYANCYAIIFFVHETTIGSSTIPIKTSTNCQLHEFLQASGKAGQHELKSCFTAFFKTA